MCLEQWEFYIVSTKYLDEHFNNAKTINLSRVQAISKKADYNNLKDVLNEYILETVDLCNGGENNSDLEETI